MFNQILPLLMSPTLEDQERHLLVKVIDRILYKLDDLVRPYVHKVGQQHSFSVLSFFKWDVDWLMRTVSFTYRSWWLLSPCLLMKTTMPEWRAERSSLIWPR